MTTATPLARSVAETGASADEEAQIAELMMPILELANHSYRRGINYMTLTTGDQGVMETLTSAIKSAIRTALRVDVAVAEPVGEVVMDSHWVPTARFADVDSLREGDKLYTRAPAPARAQEVTDNEVQSALKDMQELWDMAHKQAIHASLMRRWAKSLTVLESLAACRMAPISLPADVAAVAHLVCDDFGIRPGDLMTRLSVLHLRGPNSEPHLGSGSVLPGALPAEWRDVAIDPPVPRIRVILAEGDFVIGDCFFGAGSVKAGLASNPDYVAERAFPCWRYTETENALPAHYKPSKWQPLPLPPNAGSAVSGLLESKAPADEAASEADRLRAGNTVLLDALMGMVGQFFHGELDGVLSHSFMSAQEAAIDVLIQAGMAVEDEPNKNAYRLNWDALEARKPKQRTSDKAVDDHVSRGSS